MRDGNAQILRRSRLQLGFGVGQHTSYQMDLALLPLSRSVSVDRVVSRTFGRLFGRSLGITCPVSIRLDWSIVFGVFCFTACSIVDFLRKLKSSILSAYSCGLRQKVGCPYIAQATHSKDSLRNRLFASCNPKKSPRATLSLFAIGSSNVPLATAVVTASDPHHCTSPPA